MRPIQNLYSRRRIDATVSVEEAVSDLLGMQFQQRVRPVIISRGIAAGGIRPVDDNRSEAWPNSSAMFPVAMDDE